MKTLLFYFAAGAVGAIANSLVVWLFGDLGINKMLSVSLAPALTPPWLYPRIVWGGIWGMTFILPFMNSRPISKGILLSFLPTIVQLFVIFPKYTPQGMLGLGLGALTPLLVVFFNAIWGFVAGLTVKVSK